MKLRTWRSILLRPFRFSIIQRPVHLERFLITVPPQIYKIEAAPVSDFVAVNLWGTAPLNYQTSQVSDPTPGLAFDFSGFTLNPCAADLAAAVRCPRRSAAS